ncbi:MAG: sugar-binding domain-containing protein, partial [Planctomycetota bacterium]
MNHLRVILWFTIGILLSINVNAGADVIDLSGQWRYDLDPGDAGVTPGQWYKNTLSGTGFNLPGTTSDNLIGDDYWDTYEVPPAPDAMWRFVPRHQYLGPAWYQRTIDIPPDWNGQRITLFLERIIWTSRVWIDDTEVGSARDSLVSPHLYDLTSYVTPGSSHRLTIRIDNSHQGPDHEVGIPHAYTDQTQTIWNGIVGRIELAATDKLWIDDVQIVPDITNKTARIKIKTGNTTGSTQNVTLTVSAQSFNSPQSHTPAGDVFSYICPAGGGENSFDYTVGEGMLTWSEFDPSLYHFTVNVSGGGYSDEKRVDAGMRQIAVNGTQFTINGTKIFLRGTIDCAINPLTGYPPMDLTSWLDIMQTVKDYGFNHVRYHSWCPPKAAFDAANRLGLYLQVEGPVWGSIDSTNYDYLLAEATRIVNTYGNSPSFCMFSNGNELSGGYTLWSDILLSLKSLDTSTRHVYTVMAGWGSVAQPGEDYKCMLDSPTANYLRASYGHFGAAGQGETLYVPGLGTNTTFDWSVGKSEVSIPVVSHEIGQYIVFPNTDEIPKYNGVLRPVNYEAVKVALEQKGLLSYVSDYVTASGKLALLLYKAELEAALRTDGFGGFQMLQLTDFPGQSTATVGLLDALWDSKGICTPSDFKEFCSETVPLANMSKYVWENNETFTADVELAHFGPGPLTDAAFQWAIKDGVQTVFSGSFAIQTISNGNGIALGSINQDLSSIASAKELTLSIWLAGTSILNEWNIYVYPVTPPVSEETLLAQGNIMVSSLYGAAEQAHLDSGGNVLIVAETAALADPIRGSFFPIFWAPPVEANGGWPNRPCG